RHSLHIEQEADDDYLPESLMGPEINEGPPHIHRFRQKNVGRSSPNNQQHGDLKDDDEPERRLRNHAVGRKRAENFTRKGTSASSCRVACGWCCACSHRSSRWLHGIHSCFLFLARQNDFYAAVLGPALGGRVGCDGLGVAVCLDSETIRSEERRVGKECRAGWWADVGREEVREAVVCA